MNRKENLIQQIKLAEHKYATLQSNVTHLEEKRRNIDKTIEDQKAKMQKIQFFLEKTKKTLED